MCGSKENRMPAGRSACAFTLVELLVVTTMIALLVALLVPVASSAWQAAHMTRCKTNLFRIYQAQAQWRADNNSALLTGSRWMRYLWPYVEGDETVFHCATRGAWGYSREAMEEWAANRQGGGGQQGGGGGGQQGGGSGDDYWGPDSSPWERNMSDNPFSQSGNDPDAIFEFYVYLQKGSTGVNPGDGSESHERGDFAHSIPLGGHPWVKRTDHGGYMNYKVDDTATGSSSHDDIELNIHYNEEGDPCKVDIIKASGSNTWSMRKRFIVDFHICGERVVKDWGGMENPDRTNHYGKTITIEYEQGGPGQGGDGLDPSNSSGGSSSGGWVRPGATGRGFDWEPATMTATISGGLSRYYGDYAINLGTYSRHDGSTVMGVDGKLFYVLDYGGWDLVANYSTGSLDRWDKYFIWSPKGQADAISVWQAAFPGEGDWKSWQALRHFGKANVLFRDGHIESLGPEELEQSDPRWSYEGR